MRSLSTMSGRTCDVVTGVTIGEPISPTRFLMTVYPCVEAPGYKLEYVCDAKFGRHLIARSIVNTTTVHFFENTVRDPFSVTGSLTARKNL